MNQTSEDDVTVGRRLRSPLGIRNHGAERSPRPTRGDTALSSGERNKCAGAKRTHGSSAASGSQCLVQHLEQFRAGVRFEQQVGAFDRRGARAEQLVVVAG